MFDQYTDGGARGESDGECRGEDDVSKTDIALYRKVLNSDLHHDMIFAGEGDGEEDEEDSEPATGTHKFKKTKSSKP